MSTPTTPVTIDWHEFTRIWFAYCHIAGFSPGYSKLAAAMATYEQLERGMKYGWPHYLNLAANLMQCCADEDNRSLMRRKARHERYGWHFSHEAEGWTATNSNYRTKPYFALRDLLESLPKGAEKEVLHRTVIFA